VTTQNLLDPLTPDQQALVDLVAEAYALDDDGRWPIFDYVEAKFDAQHKDAWEVLYSLPRIGRWQYGPAWWVGMNHPTMRPSPETEIELTIVGMWHSPTLRDSVAIFLTTLRFMVEIQRTARPSTRQPRKLELDAKKVNELVAAESRVPLAEWTLDKLPTLWRREPATFGSGESRDPEGAWTKGIPRTVLDYEGVSTIEEYVDWDRRRLHIQRRYSDRTVKQGGKTGARRHVPFGSRVEAALRALPPRLDTQVLFPAPRGGYIDIEKFRHREWTPAVKAAGLEHRTLYDCRHTYASWQLQSVPPAKLAKIMGTSIAQLDDTYHHLMPTDDEYGTAVDGYGVAAGVT
jgi:hypothetical protein